MAHNCPECGYICHCRGDIDDIGFGERLDCICCENKLDDPDDFLEDDYEEEEPDE